MVFHARFIPCIVASALIACGCSTTSPGAQSNPGNRISKSADALRLQAPVPQALPTELEKQMLPEYIVWPGDVLRAEIVDLDSPIRLPADQPVQIDGKIDLGGYGRLFVAGLTLENAEKLVRTAIKAKSKDAGEIRLRLLTAESKTYFVLGEVNAPGEFTLAGRESGLNGIVRAGGLTNNADVAKILVSRPTRPCEPRKVMPVCYRDIVQIGDTSTNYQLQPGDRVFVPKSSWWERFWKFFQCDKDCDLCERPQQSAPATPLMCTDEDGAIVLPAGGAQSEVMQTVKTQRMQP